MRKKTQQMNTDIFSNETLKEVTDCLFWFLQIIEILQKGVVPLVIIYQKVLLKIITSSPIKQYQEIRKLTTG